MRLFDDHLDSILGPQGAGSDENQFDAVMGALQKPRLKVEPANRTPEFVVIDHLGRPKELIFSVSGRNTAVIGNDSR